MRRSRVRPDGGRLRSDVSGFTLIELMIVIVVLGILAGIVLFKVGSFRDEAATSACRTDDRTLATARAAYAVSHPDEGEPSDKELFDEGLIKNMPSACELALTPPEDDGGGGGGGGSTTVGVAAASGSTLPAATVGTWTATINVTVHDGDGAPVSGALVDGAWDDGKTPDSCTTNASGTCSFASDHTTSSPSTKVTWSLSSVTAAGHTAGPNAVSSLKCSRPSSSSSHPCTA